MHRFHRWLTMLALVLLAGCDGDDHDYPGYQGPPAGTYANLQVINTSFDAPPMDVLLDGAPLVQHLDYGQGTAELSIPPGSHTVIIQIETPGAPTTVSTTTLSAAANMDYVLAVEGLVGSAQPPALTTFVLPHQLAQVPPRSAQIQVLNTTVNATISVYVTAPGADISTSTPLGAAPLMGAVGPTDVAAGASEITITESAGSSSTVVYDSGPITLQGGTDLVLPVLQTTPPPPPYGTAGAVPAPPLLMTAVDALGNVRSLPAATGGTALRVVNNSSSLAALTVTATSSANATLPIATALAYGTATAYINPPLGTYDFVLASASNPSDALASQNIALISGAFGTLYSFGPSPQIFPFITHDDVRRYSTQARVRFIQGSPSASVIDLYLTPSGAGIAGATPVYSALPFLSDTGFVSYAAGAYELTVTGVGSKTPIIGPVALTATNGGLYTAVASDAPTGGAPLGLIELDDF
jgi:hypothetical protein